MLRMLALAGAAVAFPLAAEPSAVGQVPLLAPKEPQLDGAAPLTGPTPGEADQTLSVQTWTALGANWWYMFVDGWAQPGGEHVFDGTSDSKQNGQAGNFSGLLQVQYEIESQPAQMNSDWTIERVISLNVGLRNTTCNTTLCLEQFSTYVPRGGGLLSVNKGPVHDVLGDSVNNRKHLTLADKRQLVNETLVAYYAAVGASTVNSSDWASPRRAMGAVLLPLARLYATMAEIHAFHDANSRTRAFLLDSELSRLGGHPTILYETGWAVYYMKDEAEVELFIIRGWCAWEIALKNGQTPYDALGPWDPKENSNNLHKKAAYARAGALSATFYNSATDACNMS